MKLKLILLDHTYAVNKFNKEAEVPQWIKSSEFYSVTKTDDELSVIAVQPEITPRDIIINKDWRLIKVAGPLDFSLTGVIAEISGILREKKISILTISTFDTDYFLVRQEDLIMAIESLRTNGHIMIT